MKDSVYRKAYDALEDEFTLAVAIAEARESLNQHGRLGGCAQHVFKKAGRGRPAYNKSTRSW